MKCNDTHLLFLDEVELQRGSRDGIPIHPGAPFRDLGVLVDCAFCSVIPPSRWFRQVPCALPSCHHSDLLLPTTVTALP